MIEKQDNGAPTRIPVIVAAAPAAEPEKTRGKDRSLTLLSDYMHTEVKEIDTDKLAAEINKFVKAFQKVVGSIETELERYHLETVSISAEVGGEGELKLLGTGVKIEGKGGITFEFKRV
jgi:acetaldehyde dehydrogenase (acetylating)